MAAAPPQHLNLSKNTTPKTVKPARPELLPPLDWAAGHGPVSGALSATTGAGAVALVGTLAHMPPGWPMAIGAAGALGHGIGNSLRRRLTGRSLVTRSASWLLAGGWTSFAIAHGPLTWAAAGTLAALGVGIGTMASTTAIHEEAAEEERLADQRRTNPPAPGPERTLDARRAEIATDWEDRIRRISGVSVQIVAVEFWPTGRGFSLGCLLEQSASGAVTWRRVAQQSAALAADARLPLGCAIGVEEGHQQGTVVLDIPTENVMATTYEYPEDLTPLSVLTGLPWGLLATSEEVSVLLREACALIVGPPGSGKTTFMDAVLASFARSVDVITFVIDFNAGSLGLPWVRPYLEAEGLVPGTPGAGPAPKGTRPGVDWLASTPEEALLMVRALLAVNAARKLHYQEVMHQQDTTLLPVSAQIPQIMLVIDEGAELLSASTVGNETLKELKSGVLKLMRTTRAMGIRLVLTAVDGTISAIGDVSVRKFSPIGVALTSGESAGNNLAKLFPSARIDTSQLNAKGCGVIGSATADGFAPTGFKGWHTSPSLVRRVVLATNDRRPHLDPASTRAAGDAYTQRWTPKRAGWLWTDPGTQNRPQDTSSTSRAGGGLNLRALRDNQPTTPATAPAAGVGAEDELARRFMDEIDATFGTTTEPTTDTKPERTTTGRPGTDPGLNLSSLRGEQGPDWLPDALSAIYQAGADGMKPGAVADLVGRDRKTVRNALQSAAAKGQLVFRERGPHSVYVHPDHA